MNVRAQCSNNEKRFQPCPDRRLTIGEVNLSFSKHFNSIFSILVLSLIMSNCTNRKCNHNHAMQYAVVCLVGLNFRFKYYRNGNSMYSSMAENNKSRKQKIEN